MERIRTQIYLTRSQHRALSDEAHRLRVSLTELVRRAVESYLAPGKSVLVKDGLASLVGIGDSSLRDGSTRHDAYIAEAIEHHLKKSGRRKKAA